MGTIAKTSLAGPGQRTATETTLTASDTFTYEANTGQMLILRNATAGALSPLIDGADGTTVGCPGVGNVNVGGGYSVGSIAAGVVKVIMLDTISAYLQGAITITGGTGLVAILVGY